MKRREGFVKVLCDEEGGSAKNQKFTEIPPFRKYCIFERQKICFQYTRLLIIRTRRVHYAHAAVNLN